jgi:tetratricopeptide (TPR) repeat protein
MIFSFIFTAQSQNFEQTIQFADKQFELKNYQLAVKEYQRALFFSEGNQFDYLYQQIAHSFYINNQFEQALYFYDLSYKTAKNDSIKFERIFNRSLCFLKTNKFKQSIQELLNLTDSLSNYFNDRRNFYFAVSYFGLEDFKKSESYFLACLKNADKNARTEIEDLFGRKKNLYRPNPKTAKTLSMILPGSGQIYAGDVKNSLNSVLLTGSFVMLAIVMAQQYSILDAVLTALPWFTRYYKGGYANAKKIAQNKRAIRKDNTYKEVLQIISDSKKIQ